MNWSILYNVLVDDLVLSKGDDKSLCLNLQVVELHRSICKQVNSFLVIIMFESNTTSVEWASNNSTTNVGVVAYQLKNESGSD